MTENIIVFDLETTGLNKNKDHIIQIAAMKINVKINKIIDTLNLYIQPKGGYTMDMAAYMKHGITPKFLQDKPYLEDVAEEIVTFFGDYDVLGYNSMNFDIPMLTRELNDVGWDIDFMHRNCYDAFMEEKRRNGNTLGETYARYAGKTMEDAGLTAHDALGDIKATYSIFYAQQKKKSYGPEEMLTIDGTIKTMDFKGEQKPCFTMGKYRCVSVEYVAQIDKGYLDWAVSDKCGFDCTTKDFIRKYIK